MNQNSKVLQENSNANEIQEVRSKKNSGKNHELTKFVNENIDLVRNSCDWINTK